MRVYYEWHFEEIEPNEDVIDFSFADTLDELFRNIAPNKVKEMMDKQTHRLTIQKWDGANGDEQIVDYAYTDLGLRPCTIVAGSDFGILPKRFQKELDRFLGGK
tara:strand:- start:309 stop:620 length:312 start_codon:yes stop_codon:yes gene_type:complete